MIREVFVKKNNGDFSGVDIRPLNCDITFENVTVNGKKLDRLSDFNHNEYIKNIRFK